MWSTGGGVVVVDHVDAFMRESDAFSWYMEHDPALRSTIVAVAWLDRSPKWDTLVDRLERATRLVPIFRQRPVEPPGRLATPRWTVDPDFDLTWHLRRVTSPPPHSQATVIEMARIMAMSGFDAAHPLWEFTLVEDLADGGAALVMKLHHSLTDGIGGMQLLFALFDTCPDPPPPGVGSPNLPINQQAERHTRVRVSSSWRPQGAGLCPAPGDLRLSLDVEKRSTPST